jgi:hypothetical protein
MARAYEDDLRRKFLGAYDQGEGTLEQLAGVFGVSLKPGQEDIFAAQAHLPGGAGSPPAGS